MNNKFEILSPQNTYFLVNNTYNNQNWIGSRRNNIFKISLNKKKKKKKKKKL